MKTKKTPPEKVAKEPETKKVPAKAKPRTHKKQVQEPVVAAPVVDAVEVKESEVVEPVLPLSALETPFDLLVSEKIVSSPRLKIGWRLPKSIVDQIREDEATKEACILLAIINQETGKVVRIARPLLQQLEIIDYSFDRPGKYAILATIIWGNGGCDDKLQEMVNGWERLPEKACYYLLTPENNTDCWDIDYVALRKHLCINHNRIRGKAAIDLEISRGFFAKDRPAWLLKWVDSGYPCPSQSDCEFDHRALFWAFSMKFVWLMLWGIGYGIGTAFWAIVFAGYMTVGLAFGRRKLVWRAVRHPWTTQFKGYGPSIFTTKKDGSPQPWLLRLLCPPIALGLVVGGHIAWRLIRLIPYEWIPTILWVATYVAIGGASILLLGWIARMSIRKAKPTVSRKLESFGDSLVRWGRGHEGRVRAKRRQKQFDVERKENEAAKLVQARVDMALGQLVDRPDLVNIKLVPREFLPWYVRWLNFKTTVCRPFARK